MGITMEISPSSLSVEPGRLGSVHVHLRNDGAGVSDVAVNVPPDDRYWSWVHPLSCPVEPGGQAEVSVFFKPKCGPQPCAGIHRVEIVASAADGGQRLAAAEAAVEVGPYSDAAGALDPMVGRDQRAHSYTFNLENTGNVPMHASLSTDDPSGALDVDVRPSTVTAGPGETATATVTIQARKKLKRGEQRYRVCVLAKVEGGSELRIEGAFYQQGLKPPK